MPRTRRTFTDEFKREAVKLVKQPGAKVTHIARDLGIEQSVLRRWVGQEHGVVELDDGDGGVNGRRRLTIGGRRLGVVGMHGGPPQDLGALSDPTASSG